MEIIRNINNFVNNKVQSASQPNTATNSINYSNNLKCDTFQKSTVSFGMGYIDKLVKGTSLDSETKNDGVSSVFQNLGKIFKQIRLEEEFMLYLSLLSDNSVKNVFSQMRVNSIDKANEIIALSINQASKYDPFFMLYSGETIMNDVSLILEDSGITNYMQLQSFVKLYNTPDVKKTFKYQELEALKLFGVLDTKSNLGKYGKLLLYLYNREDAKDNPDYSCVNKYIKFLEKIGVNDFQSFDTKFEHLKSNFGDFESVADRVDAIDYLQQTYDEKISLLNEIIKDKQLPKKFDSQYIYQNLNDIVDYLYQQSGGESLGDLSLYFDTALGGNKLKSTTEKAFGPLFNYYQSPKDKIEFYKLLNECGASVNDVNELSKKSIISDTDVLDYLLNYKELSCAIADIQNTDITSAQKTYKTFKEEFNALYDEKNDDKTYIDKFIKVIGKLNIKNSLSLLDIYNKTFGTKNGEISSEELKKFVEIYSIPNSQNAIADSKKQNTTPLNILTELHAKYDKAQNEIENFIKTDSTGYFAGKSTYDIYEEYGSLISENIDNIQGILQDIISFNIKNSGEYIEKSKNIDRFSPYFSNRETILKFIFNNKIRLDNSNDDNEYVQNCLTILKNISQNNTPEKAKAITNHILSSNFFIKSKESLNEFLEKYPNENERNEILQIIASKKISSINQFNKFINKYKDSNGNTNNVIKFLKALPESIKFSSCVEILEKLNKSFKNLNIPIEINNDNILAVDINYIRENPNYTPSDINKLALDLMNIDENACFISGLNDSYKNKNIKYSSYRIAQEIVNKIDKSKESYQNLTEKFGLDRQSLGLKSDCSDYVYARAIEEKLPERFIDFVNSDDWLNYENNENKIPNLTLHARLRMIDRFALSNGYKEENLYTDEMKNKLQNIIKIVYTTSPVNIRGTSESERIIINSKNSNNMIETVFSKNGELITIVNQ